MAENEGQSESGEKQPERKYSQEQYDMLIRCSKKEDMTEWNNWRKEHLDEEILLEDAKFNNEYLKEVLLNGGRYESQQSENLIRQGEVYLKGTEWHRTKLQNAKFRNVHIEGAFFYHTYMQGAVFQGATVDSYTEFWKCDVDCDTNFRGVALGSVDIDSGVKTVLEYNIRRMNWEEWYRGKSENEWVVKLRRLLTYPVRLFWSISDYGLSTKRIIFTFLAMAIIFATIYFACGAVDYYYSGIKEQPGIVKDLFVPVTDEDSVSDVYYGAMIYFRSVYFSVVTMTTLGFGDMFANPSHLGWRWWVGHSLLILQVILGYVLLGALVTRFAVLFTSCGPAGKFAKEDKS